MITTLYWIASSSLDLFLAIASWMLILQLVRALSLQLCVVFLLCIRSSMWPILEIPDSPLLLGTDKFAIHTLCTECVGLCTWLSSFRMHLMSWNCSFLSRSAWSVQSLACCRMPFFVLLSNVGHIVTYCLFYKTFILFTTNSNSFRHARESVMCFAMNLSLTELLTILYCYIRLQDKGYLSFWLFCTG